jgi:adenosylcobinamide-GDP ribazoletransferase
MKALLPFFIALQFLTRIPLRVPEAPPRTVARSLAYYPLVGLILGVLIAGLNSWLSDGPAPLRAALVLTLWVALTGALHLDGFADSVDAWVAGRGEQARTLAVMKDPHSGPMAVVAVTILLLLKFAALENLSGTGGPTLACIPLLARSAIPLLFATTPYVRPGGLGSTLASGQSRALNIAVYSLAMLATIGVAGWSGLWLVLVLASVFFVLRHAMIGRLGGTTGDTAGALVEMSEAAMLVALALYPAQQF